ncbi:hypothetical protein F4802DRAFT_231064 [Xylaria palmicola]|nr:hypothetical protein F4802DRAFT_231064 [Xylaria palmicola]
MRTSRDRERESRYNNERREKRDRDRERGSKKKKEDEPFTAKEIAPHLSLSFSCFLLQVWPHSRAKCLSSSPPVHLHATILPISRTYLSTASLPYFLSRGGTPARSGGPRAAGGSKSSRKMERLVICKQASTAVAGKTDRYLPTYDTLGAYVHTICRYVCVCRFARPPIAEACYKPGPGWAKQASKQNG